MLGAPEQDAVLQVGSHESGAEGQNHLPCPVDTAQDTVGFLACTLPGYVELLINQHAQVLLLRAALNPFSTQPVFVLWIVPTHAQDLALGLAELHEVRTGPPLKPVNVPLDGIPSLQRVDHTTQLGVIGKLAEGALNPTVHVTDKDVKWCQSQYRPLRNDTCHWCPLGHQAIDRNSLSVAIQPIPYPPSGPSITSMSLQFRDRDVVLDSVKSFAQVQGFILWYSTKQIPEEAKVFSAEVQGSPLQVLEGCYKVSSEPSLLQAEQPQLSQPVFIGEVLQPSDHFCGPSLDSLQQVHVLLMLGAPEQDAVLQVGSHESRVEGENHLPRPPGHACFDAVQDKVGFVGCKCTLPGHVELLINQHAQVLLLRAALNPFSTQPVFVLWIVPTHAQDLALGLAELHEVRTGPPLKPVNVPLDGIPSLQRVDHTTQLGVIGKLAEGALNPTVHVTDKDVKWCQSQYRPLRNDTCHWCPLGHQAIDRNSLSVAIQPIPYPPSGPSITSMSLQFRDRDVVLDSVKSFAQVQ
ncbi:hypothetical protein QYF61_019128, partial [Mycteria americana]